MKGVLKEIKKIDLKSKNGQKFSKIEFTCDVKVNDKGDIKTLKGNYGEDFAKKYFGFCNVKTKDLIGKDVECILAKREWEKDGVRRITTYIKYLNVLDENGKVILLPKEETNEELDF